MTFDELCKAVKKANKDAEVKYGVARTVVSVNGEEVVIIPEYAGNEDYWYVCPCEVEGYKEIVEASVKYTNTALSKREAQPLWLISIHKVNKKPGENGKLETKTKEVSRLASWLDDDKTHHEFWWDRYADSDPLTEEEIKAYIVALCGEEKVEKYFDFFVDMFGTRVQ